MNIWCKCLITTDQKLTANLSPRTFSRQTMEYGLYHRMCISWTSRTQIDDELLWKSQQWDGCALWSLRQYDWHPRGNCASGCADIVDWSICIYEISDFRTVNINMNIISFGVISKQNCLHKRNFLTPIGSFWMNEKLFNFNWIELNDSTPCIGHLKILKNQRKRNSWKLILRLSHNICYKYLR